MTSDSKAAQGDWAEQVARTAMGRHAVDVVALDEVASQLRASEHRGYTMGHKAGDDFRSAALASTAGAGAGDWQPIGSFPQDGNSYLAINAGLAGDGHMQVLSYDEDGRLLSSQEGLSYSPEAYTHWRTLPVRPDAPAVPASPRSGAGEEDEVKTAALNLANTIRSMFGRAIDEDGRMCDAQDPLDDLCDAIVDQVLQTFAAIASTPKAGTGDDLAEVVEWLKHACPIPAYWRRVQAVSALSQGGGAGRSEKGEGETLETIAAWCEETFGPIKPERIVSRAGEEMDELRETPERVEEAADVVICLARYPGLWAEVQRKMAVNRQRKWRLMGDGTGYHVKAAPAQSPSTSDAEPTIRSGRAVCISKEEADRREEQGLHVEWAEGVGFHYFPGHDTAQSPSTSDREG